MAQYFDIKDDFTFYLCNVEISEMSISCQLVWASSFKKDTFDI